MLLFIAFPASGKDVTHSQKELLSNILWDDLTAYMDGGNSLFADDWDRVATPWTLDQVIGQRYANGTVAADQFYGDKTIFIRGHYLGAQNWIGDAYRVQMALVVAIVEKSESSFLQDARNGGMVEMACKSSGREYQFVYVDQCQAQKFAMADLVANEMSVVLSRGSKNDRLAVDTAMRADKVISADNPCRATFGGCIDDIRALAH